MALGVFNIVTTSNFYFQSWLLGSLYNVTDHPVVKKNIFDKYLQVLSKIKENDQAAGKATNPGIIEIYDMVVKKSKGE